MCKAVKLIKEGDTGKKWKSATCSGYACKRLTAYPWGTHVQTTQETIVEAASRVKGYTYQPKPLRTYQPIRKHEATRFFENTRVRDTHMAKKHVTFMKASVPCGKLSS